MDAEPCAASAIVSAWISLAEARIDPHRRERHRPLVRVVLHAGARRRGHRVFDGYVDQERRVRRLVADAAGGVGRRFGSQHHDVARLEVSVSREARRLHAEERHRCVTALLGRHREVPNGRRVGSDQFRLSRRVRAGGRRRDPRAAIGRGKQLLAVDDGHHAVVTHAPCRVDAVADDVVAGGAARQPLRRPRMLERGDRAVQRIGNRSRPRRLPARQAERADIDWWLSIMRITPVIDQHCLRLAPQGRTCWRDGCVLAARHIRDAGAALPPVLVRRANGPEGLEKHGRRDIGHVILLVPGGGASLNVAQKVDLARRAAWQHGTQAHAHHLRLASGWRRYEGLLDRVRRIGDVDDHRAVVLAW